MFVNGANLLRVAQLTGSHRHWHGQRSIAHAALALAFTVPGPRADAPGGRRRSRAGHDSGCTSLAQTLHLTHGSRTG